jgi:hypothetical protein
MPPVIERRGTITFQRCQTSAHGGIGFKPSIRDHSRLSTDITRPFSPNEPKMKWLDACLKFDLQYPAHDSAQLHAGNRSHALT